MLNKSITSLTPENISDLLTPTIPNRTKNN